MLPLVRQTLDRATANELDLPSPVFLLLLVRLNTLNFVPTGLQFENASTYHHARQLVHPPRDRIASRTFPRFSHTHSRPSTDTTHYLWATKIYGTSTSYGGWLCNRSVALQPRTSDRGTAPNAATSRSTSVEDGLLLVLRMYS